MQQRIWIQKWPTFVLCYRGNISLNLFTFVAGIKIIISLPCLHIFCFQLCRNETEKKPEQNNVLKYYGHLGYTNGQLFHPKWL